MVDLKTRCMAEGGQGHLPPWSLDEGFTNWKKAVLQETQQEVKVEHSLSWLGFSHTSSRMLLQDCHMSMYVYACGEPVPKYPTQYRHVAG